MDSRVDSSRRPGPLAGVRVVEVGGIGPGPFAAMMLSDLGAEVVRVDRPEEDLRSTHAVLLRGRQSVVADLKSPEGLAVVLALVDRADILIEGFRPGVAERLGFGPAVALERNPGLVYGRMTGWGQDGPYAALAGHDLTYLAVAGVLDAFAGADGRPVPPLNLLGDFGGGGMLLALGVVSALWHARESGQGQVVDAAIVDGVAAMTAMHQSMLASGLWPAARGANLLDGGAPFYRCYRTADDRWLAVGAIEPVFYDRFLGGLGVDPAEVGAAQLDAEQWPRVAALFADRIAAAARGVGDRLRRPRRVRGASAHRAGGPQRSAPGRQGCVCRRPRLPDHGPTGPCAAIFSHSHHCRHTRLRTRGSYRRRRARPRLDTLGGGTVRRTDETMVKGWQKNGFGSRFRASIRG